MNTTTVMSVFINQCPAPTRASPGCSNGVPLKESLMKWPVVEDAYEATAIKIKAPATTMITAFCQFIVFPLVFPFTVPADCLRTSDQICTINRLPANTLV